MGQSELSVYVIVQDWLPDEAALVDVGMGGGVDGGVCTVVVWGGRLGVCRTHYLIGVQASC